MQQSEAACKTDVPTSMQQEAQVPGPSAASEQSLRDKTLQAVAERLGPDWQDLAVKELNFTRSQVRTIKHDNPNETIRQGLEMLVAWKHAQSTSVEQKKTTLRTALENIGRPDAAKPLHGVPAPRPQHSQKPDQEPRTPYQNVRKNLKTKYKTEGSYVQLLPGRDDDQMCICDIYTEVQLETREGTADAANRSGEIISSTEYAKIFRLTTKTGELINRLIFFGMGGVGKSTIFKKIAYDWASKASDILKSFKLVFLLKMCDLSPESDLVDALLQLLDQDSGVTKNDLDECILINPNEVLILLDGFNEMAENTETLCKDSFGSILKALNRTYYRNFFICVSTRPSHVQTLMSEYLVQNPCTHVEVLGLTDVERVEEFVHKFHKKSNKRDIGKALIETIEKSVTLRVLAQTPMLLMLLCSVWKWEQSENRQFPETLSGLFTEAVHYMFTRKDIYKETASETVIAIGKIGLRGLLRANQKFSFQEDEFKSNANALRLALKAGILTQHGVVKTPKSHYSIQFMHKRMQEYCAAKYWQSLAVSFLGIKYKKKLSQMCSTIQDVVSNDVLLPFCCGDNEQCKTDIINLLDRKFSDVDVLASIRRNCCFESRSSKEP